MSSKVSQSNDLPSKPEILNSWKTKLLILFLCVISFIAGWQASRSHLVAECQKAGAIVNIEDSLILCKIP